jgi:hypothetical protein
MPAALHFGPSGHPVELKVLMGNCSGCPWVQIEVMVCDRSLSGMEIVPVTWIGLHPEAFSKRTGSRFHFCWMEKGQDTWKEFLSEMAVGLSSWDIMHMGLNSPSSQVRGLSFFSLRVGYT